MNQIKQRSISAYLSARGIQPSVECSGYAMYLSPLRAERTPSFKVDYNQNLWYDFGSGEGGSIIDLVMRLERCDFREAAAKLENGSNFSFHRAEPVESAYSTLQIQSVQPLENRHLINYLQSKRSINIDIAREYCREVHYTTNGKPFFAVGFQSDAGGWELRNEYFKGSSSPKSPTTIKNGSPTCLLFEGFMDMLSYLTIKNTICQTVDMVVLNSTINLAKARDFLLTHRAIHCFLDNDPTGVRTLEQIGQLATATGGEVVDHSGFYQSFNDLNEYLSTQKRSQKLDPSTSRRGPRM